MWLVVPARVVKGHVRVARDAMAGREVSLSRIIISKLPHLLFGGMLLIRRKQSGLLLDRNTISWSPVLLIMRWLAELMLSTNLTNKISSGMLAFSLNALICQLDMFSHVYVQLSFTVTFEPQVSHHKGK